MQLREGGCVSTMSLGFEGGHVSPAAAARRGVALVVGLIVLSVCASGQPSGSQAFAAPVSTPTPAVAQASMNDVAAASGGDTTCVGPPRNGECFPTHGPGGWTLQRQDMLAAWADRAYMAVGRAPGFADMGLDFAHGGVIVYFRGAIPAKLAAIAARAKSHGVLIELVRARFGQYAYERDVDRLADALDAARIRWNSIGADGAYSRLEIGGPVVSKNPAVQARVRRIARDTIGNIPIAFISDPGVAVTLAATGKS